MSTTTVKNRTRWDEPARAVTPRGWLFVGGRSVGFYLDYGRDHYRSPHEYCSVSSRCRACEPGNVLAVVVGEPRRSRYCVSVAAARAWVEVGV